jgi:hypothetical protein
MYFKINTYSADWSLFRLKSQQTGVSAVQTLQI